MQKHKNETYFYGFDFVPIMRNVFTINSLVSDVNLEIEGLKTRV